MFEIKSVQTFMELMNLFCVTRQRGRRVFSHWWRRTAPVTRWTSQENNFDGQCNKVPNLCWNYISGLHCNFFLNFVLLFFLFCFGSDFRVLQTKSLASQGSTKTSKISRHLGGNQHTLEDTTIIKLWRLRLLWFMLQLAHVNMWIVIILHVCHLKHRLASLYNML